jgi:hypothetical protein
MATDTLIQYLETTDAAGVALDGAVSHRRQIETFIAGGTITAGEVVAFDTSATGAARAVTVVQAPNVATGAGGACGVALESVASGKRVKVIVAGYAEGVKCAAGVAAGDPLTVGQATAGEVDTRVAADTSACFGVALEAVAASKVDMMVFKQF